MSLHEMVFESDRCEHCLRSIRAGDQGVASQAQLGDAEFFWLCRSCYDVEMARQSVLTPGLFSERFRAVRAMWARVIRWPQLAHLVFN